MPIVVASRAAAVAMLALAAIAVYYTALAFGPVAPLFVRPDAAGEYRVMRPPDPVAARAGVRLGDQVDMTGLSRRERFLVVWGNQHTPVAYPVVHDGRRRTVVLADVPHGTGVPTLLVVGACGALITLAICAVILWRRPSVMALALAGYGIGTLYVGPLLNLVSGFPDGLFAVVEIVVMILVGPGPSLALVAFAMRFPSAPKEPRRRVQMHVVDGILVCVALLFVLRAITMKTHFESVWYLDVVPSFVAVAAVFAVVIARLVAASGDERRRLGWVLGGLVVSALAYAATGTTGFGGVTVAPLRFVATPLHVALPLALAYAILRHRVLDIGFALNRTLVYGALTALVVVTISGLDWILGRFLAGSKLTAVIEAVVTIAIGVALNWIHARIERFVERVLFRERHRALGRLDTQIRALDFADDRAVVDRALVDEVVDVLRLCSAAVFRDFGDGSFRRVRALGWDGAATAIDAQDLLIRSLRADEAALFLADLGTAGRGFPGGAARPDIVFPIVVRHVLLGVVLYGHRDGNAAVDPEERAVLARLVRFAATAYDAIDALELRRMLPAGIAPAVVGGEGLAAPPANLEACYPPR